MSLHDTMHDTTLTTIRGARASLADHRDRVVLIVNVASQCGFTPQYEGLETLWRRYRDQGLVVLGFPCDQFGHQEPGTEAEIAEFCQLNYGVTFPMFAKIDVNGEKAAPLYKHLTSKEAVEKDAGPVKWNFEKFLIGRDGKVVARFRTGVEPDDEKVVAAIEKELAKK